jgi:hypothetical protein
MSWNGLAIAHYVGLWPGKPITSKLLKVCGHPVNFIFKMGN